MENPTNPFPLFGLHGAVVSGMAALGISKPPAPEQEHSRQRPLIFPPDFCSLKKKYKNYGVVLAIASLCLPYTGAWSGPLSGDHQPQPPLPSVHYNAATFHSRPPGPRCLFNIR